MNFYRYEWDRLKISLLMSGNGLPDGMGQEMDIAHSSWQKRETSEKGETQIVNGKS
jgi:hypothetical protein